MTSKTLHPVYALRAYIWAVLKENEPDAWKESLYGGLVPIVPLNEEPDLSEFDGPRIIYDFSIASPGPLYARGRGTMTLAIRDHNYRRLTRTMNILQASLERNDESARDVNDWIDKFSPTFDLSFGTISVGFAESGTPETEEGGFMIGIVSVDFDYFLDHLKSTDNPTGVNTRPGL